MSRKPIIASFASAPNAEGTLSRIDNMLAAGIDTVLDVVHELWLRDIVQVTALSAPFTLSVS
ncbi:MAG: hypothetical protein WBP81_30090 [Solirubrobacteraceae bacterium]